MRAPAAAYVLGREGFDRIYGPDQRTAIAQTCANDPPFVPAEQATAGDPRLADVEIILSGWGAPVMDEAFCERLPQLRAVLYGAGSVRGFVTEALARRGVVVSSAVAGNAIPVAEYTVATVLFSLKLGWEFMRSPRPRSVTEKDVVPGAYGSTVGVVALGTIGRLVCERLRDADLRLVAFDPYASTAAATALGVQLVGLDELFATSDVVTLHAPLHEGTRGMVGAHLLESMKPRATLINTARGAVVRHDDLIEVLTRRPDLQAVLDVTDPEPLSPDSPLRSLPNVVLTPHIAGSLGRECHRMGAMMAEELRRYADGEPLRWQVPLDRLDIAALP